MRTVRESNKKSFREKLFSPRSLFIIYILLPLLIIGIGFSAWSTITPTFGGSVSSNLTSERVIDTSALMHITNFEPYVKQLYYTGPVDENGKLLNELHIDSKIELFISNIYSLAKDCGKNDLYLSLTLSLKSGVESDIFYDLKTKNTHFTTKYDGDTQNGTTIGNEDVILSLKKYTIQPEPTTSSITLMLLINFNDLSKENPFSENDKLAITPEFILDADGYPTFFDLAMGKTEFRLDLRLSENAPQQ